MSSLVGILEYSKLLIERYHDCEGIAIDMTLGKGNDTIYLANHFKKVYAFDIQKEAIELSSKKMDLYDNVVLINDNHDNFVKYLDEKVNLFIYNLGYLPGFSHDITTLATTTISSLQKALTYLKSEGIIIIVVYPGHPQGLEESLKLEKFCQELKRNDYKISKYQIISSDNAPYVLGIHKKRKDVKDGNL